jgi:dihydroorotate dehydrogenase electron transfer subunit
MPDDIVNITGNTPLTGGHFLLSVEAPRQAAQAQPGQFAMLHILGRSDVLLRRPLSIFDITAKTGRQSGPRSRQPKQIVQFLYKQVGRGTRLMAELKRGDKIGLLGPLGHGFFEEEYLSQVRQADEVLHVAGGIGIAALLLPVRHLAKAGIKQRLFFGARTKDDLVAVEKFRPLVSAIQLATEDGSAGAAGFVTQPLQEYLSANPHKKLLLMACGPVPMLRATVELANRFGHSCLVSMENRMACGLGACLGCAIRVKGEGYGAYQRVCKDGPVFWADKIVWD